MPMRCGSVQIAAALICVVTGIAASGRRAETCTCSAEAFLWTSLAATVPSASWDGCSPSTDDDSDLGVGCEVTIPGGSRVDLSSHTGEISLLDDSRLEIQAGRELVVSNEGITVRDVSALAIQGRALRAVGPPVQDCDGSEADPGSAAEAAIRWPDARFDGALGSARTSRATPGRYSSATW